MGRVVSEGLISAGTSSISYPAFGLNKTGAGALGMTITNKSKSVVGGFPSAAFIQFTPTGSITITGPGFTSDDGFTGCRRRTGQSWPLGRLWRGDRGFGDGFFYTANEMIPNPAVFPRGADAYRGTLITQYHRSRSARRKWEEARRRPPLK